MSPSRGVVIAHAVSVVLAALILVIAILELLVEVKQTRLADRDARSTLPLLLLFNCSDPRVAMTAVPVCMPTWLGSRCRVRRTLHPCVVIHAQI